MEIKTVIDRFEGELAVLIADDRTSIRWPKGKLPAGAAEGQVITINITTDAERENERRETAKEILNEILNPEA